ncbi:response regulator receiver protein [Granulicella tundricola MP5ACTX9]|uniref:Response regulator receiver protein n=1 Tax=Granulicella tundricola (strain ATCC BAA-1859 / DSM 23138 / MP5ACTX9) TaxID=1198114 RepID=E8X4R1_GRATM|nr:response regulator [Granulicella tundricola]ADW70550.1 response regulator receiver protein [Granulicella tundricola MP5ACTX9]
MPKRRVLLVDDEIAVLLTLKAVLEISGFDVDTAASAREAKSKLKSKQYEMVITDMRMESEVAGREVIVAARTADYHPAVALLTAFPVADEDWQDMGADKMLVKPMQTRSLIQSIEKLLESHQAKLKKLEKGGAAATLAAGFAAGMAAAKTTTPSPAPKKAAKAPAKSATVKKTATAKKTAKKATAVKAPAKKKAVKKK